MLPVVVYPDAEALVLDAIADELSVTKHSVVPTDRDGTETFLACRRVGGPNRDVVVDDATLSIEAWAPTKAAAHDLIQQARGVLHSLVGSQLDGVPVYDVSEFAGPAYLPDPDSSHPRYTLTASVSLRGSTPTGS